MKKLYLIILIGISFTSSINLISAEWEWIKKDNQDNIISTTTEFKILNGEKWLSTPTNMYKYENGLFVSKDATPVVEELFFCGLRSLTLDRRGNLIGRNNNGIAWYDGEDWTVLGANDINYIQFNRGISLTPNDTLVLTLISREMVKFVWDIANEKYTQLPNEKLIMPNEETQIGTGGALILAVNETHKALFSTNSKLNLLEFSSGQVKNINDRLQFDTSNIKEFYGFFDSGLSYYFNYVNKDSSASLLVMSKDLLYPAFHLTFRNPDWDITQITSVVDYNNEGLFYALGDKLYFTNLSDTILIPRPKILGDDIDNMWYITTMDIDENDTLWVGTLSSGVFKIYVPNLFSTSSVESEISNLNIYPNPAKDEINISYDKTINSIEILDLNGKSVLNNKNLTPKKEQNIKMDFLQSGSYFIRINDNVYKRFLKE
ncbi:MAG: hypothetical protein CVV25_11890 [Ignavibacteriae bacterium HGW-Ignavibacteriae-4]|jgi:hypothetical protein|nr:MAG: hypothetical protein CVV25_11890 [Ignavibacteriae bacterium HGW-Ignavibacteriae-4]